VAIAQGDVMFGRRRFRFRSPERDRETAERSLWLIRTAVHFAVAEADTEFNGLVARVAKTRRSVTSLLAQVDRKTDSACRTELTNLEQSLVSGQRSLAQLDDHLTALRELKGHLDRLFGQAPVSDRLF
jgi:hypothetical protein